MVKKRSDIGKVYDELGVVRQGKEAVWVWKRCFQNVLNEGGRSEVQGDEGGEEVNGGNELLNEDVTREEGSWWQRSREGLEKGEGAEIS